MHEHPLVAVTGDPASRTGHLHASRASWVAVALMCLGSAFIAAGICSFSASHGVATALLVAGAVTGLVGMIAGRASHIMEQATGGDPADRAAMAPREEHRLAP